MTPPPTAASVSTGKLSKARTSRMSVEQLVATQIPIQFTPSMFLVLGRVTAAVTCHELFDGQLHYGLLVSISPVETLAAGDDRRILAVVRVALFQRD